MCAVYLNSLCHLSGIWVWQICGCRGYFVDKSRPQDLTTKSFIFEIDEQSYQILLREQRDLDFLI